MENSLNDANKRKVKFDDEKLLEVKTVGSNEIESKAFSTLPENENAISSRSKRSRKIPKRYLNYELD